jgi:hypothetical protein
MRWRLGKKYQIEINNSFTVLENLRDEINRVWENNKRISKPHPESA